MVKGICCLATKQLLLRGKLNIVILDLVFLPTHAHSIADGLRIQLLYRHGAWDWARFEGLWVQEGWLLLELACRTAIIYVLYLHQLSVGISRDDVLARTVSHLNVL